MAKYILDIGHRKKALAQATLEGAIQFLLQPYDFKGANPYLRESEEKKTFALANIVDALEDHDELVNKSPRMRNDKVRGVLNAMMSIVRVGSTRKARYGYDSYAEQDLGSHILDDMVKVLLDSGGKADWKDIQEALKVDKIGGITHLEFNSAVNYLVDNGVAEKKGRRTEREDDGEGNLEILRKDSRELSCTSKAWGWEAGVAKIYDHEKDELVENVLIGGSRKKTYSITLTQNTSEVLKALEPLLEGLPGDHTSKPANVNRSTIIEVALWTLYRQIKMFEGDEMPIESSDPEMPEIVEAIHTLEKNLLAQFEGWIGGAARISLEEKE